MPKLPVKIAPTDAAAVLTTAEAKLSKAEADLRSLEADTASEPSAIIQRRNVLIHTIADLKQEIAILERRAAAEEEQKAQTTHEARVSRLRSILQRRLVALRKIEAAILEIGAAVSEVDAIDRDEVSPIMGGVDSRFEIQKRTFQHVILHKLAEAGVGEDRRLDRSLPTPTVSEHGAKLHALMISELADLPRVRAEDKARQAAAVAAIEAARYV
jgi:hypothetical protein